MEYVIILVLGLVMGWLVNDRLKPKTTKIELTQEEKVAIQRINDINNQFNELMNYSEGKAIRGDKL